MAHCEASAIFLFPIDLKLLGHLFLSISLPHAKEQPHLPNNYNYDFPKFVSKVTGCEGSTS